MATLSFEELDNALPEGFTAELINGRIIVAPAPDGDRDEDVIYVANQIHARVPEVQLYQERGLAVDAYRDGRARADGVVAPRRHFRGQSSIPVYLLVDRHRGESVVHWGPANGRYTHQASAVFGEKLSLPEPFGFELDTSELT